MRAQGVLSQREVARRLGISHALVAQAERSAISKICAALDLPSPYAYVGKRRGWQARISSPRTPQSIAPRTKLEPRPPV